MHTPGPVSVPLFVPICITSQGSTSPPLLTLKIISPESSLLPGDGGLTPLTLTNISANAPETYGST